ncbi:MAG: HD domain-containing protein [Bacilli bacterium]|nr:HD domain-containing protein [Bacilli bacterium]
MNYLEQAKQNFLSKEENLSEYATKSKDAIRLKPLEEDLRPNYFRDIDRIIHSLSYTRYADKTQVFSYKENDHISKRMIHVQLVSKVARTIGRALNLNEDLIEAIALGHDIGHTPLGHEGEYILDEISQRELGEKFAHNIQSVRHCMYVENKGEGLNLSIQVLDGIMCHNGEMLSNKYIPMKKDKEEFLKEFENSYKDYAATKKCSPMTLEGCVVRISDIIGYIGRDIEDAISLGKIKREEIPKEISDILGTTNKEIINTIILDIIKESIGKPYIGMSENIYNALFALKKFNSKNIYSKSMTLEEKEYYKTGMNILFNDYLNAIEKQDKTNIIYEYFLNHINDNYLKNTPKKRMVIDFIAGMTDDLFISELINHNHKMQ